LHELKGYTAYQLIEDFRMDVFTCDSIYATVRSLYAIARLSVCPSVRSTVTWVDHTKMVEVRIMEFSSYGSPIPLVFAGEVLSRNSKGFPERGVKRERGG